MSGWMDELLKQYTDLWWACEPDAPPLGRTYTLREQAAAERGLERFLVALNAELERLPHTRAERAATQARLTAAFARFAQGALGFEQRHLDALVSSGFAQAATAFAQMARRFDPAISGRDIYQASRNVWTMNLIQLLLGLPAQLTPSVLAYSLLYPYSDNYLDDATISLQTKAAFNARFGRRLEGEPIAPTNAHERAIYDLVALIEGQFERARCPQVYESLLAIHRAQTQSLRLLRPGASPYEVDVLGITFEKGGTSVLADGYLVAGALTRTQAEFMFGYGAFTQLMDDLEDVEQDAREGIMTIFSQTAGRWKLDALTSRLFRFGAHVLESLDRFEAPGAKPIVELAKLCVQPLLLDAAGSAWRYHTPRYLRELEAHSPFRFAFLRRQRARLDRRRAALMRLVDVFAASNDLEDALPGAWAAPGSAIEPLPRPS